MASNAATVTMSMLERPNDLFGQDELNGLADSMNNRPRATRAWHAPLEVFPEHSARLTNCELQSTASTWCA